MNPVARVLVTVRLRNGDVFRCAAPLPRGRTRTDPDLTREDASWIEYVWLVSRTLHMHHARSLPRP